jgi:hypothetical protein
VPLAWVWQLATRVRFDKLRKFCTHLGSDHSSRFGQFDKVLFFFALKFLISILEIEILATVHLSQFLMLWMMKLLWLVCLFGVVRVSFKLFTVVTQFWSSC